MKVTAQCIGCGAKRSFGPEDVARGDHPMCDSCFMPMIAVSASSDCGEPKAKKAKPRGSVRRGGAR